LPSVRALMTLPRQVSERLIFLASSSRWPSAWVVAIWQRRKRRRRGEEEGVGRRAEDVGIIHIRMTDQQACPTGAKPTPPLARFPCFSGWQSELFGLLEIR